VFKQVVTAALMMALAAAAAPSAAEAISFETHIQPIFMNRCAACHAPPGRLRGGLDLSTAELTLKGGLSGPEIIVPGDPDASPLVQMIEWALEPVMPPSEDFSKLPQEEINLIRQWIAEGAVSTGAAPLPAAATTPIAPADPEAAARAPVSAVAFAPDGRMLAKGGLHTVQLLTLDESGAATPVQTLEGHAEMVRALAFSPDGALLAAAGGLPGRAGEVKVWHTGDWSLAHTIAAHYDAILSIAFSPDGAQLATGSYDHLVKIFDAASGAELYSFADHVDAIYAVAYSPDGNVLASGSGDRTVKLWNAADGARLLTLSDSTAGVKALAFSPDGRYIAAGAADKMIRVWDVLQSGGALRQSALTAGVLEHSTFAHEGPVLHIAYAPDGASLYSTAEDRRIKVWDTATMNERLTLEPQPDWVQALALSTDGARLAIGRYNATSAVYAADSGELLWSSARAEAGPEPTETAAAEAREPEPEPAAELVTASAPASAQAGRVNAVLIDATIPPSAGNVNPVRWHRGESLELTVNGKNLADAQPFFTDWRIEVEVLENEALPIPEFTYNEASLGAQIFDFAQPHQLKLRVTLPEDLGPGTKHLLFRTPHGISNPATLTVLTHPDLPKAEAAETLAWPATVAGALSGPGEVDRFQVEVEAGTELVFAITDSANNTLLRLLDGDGEVLRTSREFGTGMNPRMGHRFETGGTYTVEYSDPDLRGNVGYRLHVDIFPLVTSVFPLGVAAGARQQVQVTGFNTGGGILHVDPPAEAGRAQTIPLPLPAHEANPIAAPRIAVSPYRELIVQDPATTPESAPFLPESTAINTRLATGEEHLYRFAARKGETIILETEAAFLGSPLDTVLEILDLDGQPLKRALARSVALTHMTLSERDSRSAGLRIEDWSDFRMNDYLMVGGEIVRVVRLPGYADEDISLAAFPGQRRTYFGTSPEFHAVNTPVYKVEMHPVGAELTPNGMPVFPIYWRNDDFLQEGRPRGDSRVEFEAPEDGEYLVRVADARGAGGEDGPYRLILRAPQPDFEIVMDPYWMNVAEGTSQPVNVRVRRFDGFDGPVRLHMPDLPEGLSAGEAEILPGADDINLALHAAPGAASSETSATFPIVATAEIGGETVTREARMGAITVSTEQPDLIVRRDTERLPIAPGDSEWLGVHLERHNGFSSRVPISLLNLPFGVRVLDTGLNGILVREGEHDRSMEVFVEPWVQPGTHTIYVQARIESTSPGRMVFISEPIELEIRGTQTVAAGS